MSDTVSVTVSDFPCFDGSTSAEDFLTQCKRLGDLGSLTPATLGKVIAARCTGRALQVVNELEGSTGGLTFESISEVLQSHFSARPTADQAAVLLSRLTKGSLSAREYGQRVKALVRHACPEFFSGDQVKKICVPAYEAALYRHFLVGLSPGETALLSRMKATTFETAIKELVREETLTDYSGDGDTFSAAHVARGDRPAVRWASPVRRDRPEEHDWGERGSPPRERSRDSRARPSYRRPMDEEQEPDGCVSPGGRDESPRWRSGGDRRWRDRGRSPSGRPPTRRGARGPSRVSAGRSPSPGGSRGADRGEERSRLRGDGSDRTGDFVEERRGGREGPAREGEPYHSGSPAGRAGVPRCWSCRGWGHLKRHCPNGLVADGW